MSRFILIALWRRGHRRLRQQQLGECLSAHQARQAWTVEEGKVSGIKDVTIEGERTLSGPIGGGYVGYEVGRTVGGGPAATLPAQLERWPEPWPVMRPRNALRATTGLEITVDLDKGATVAVVQAADQPFEVGERVKMLRRGDGAARVTKI